MIKNNYFNFIAISQITVVSVLIFGIIGLTFPSIIKYGALSISLFFLIRGLIKDHLKVSNFFVILFYMWILFLLYTSIPDLQDSYLNYIRLKQFLSGTLIIYISSFLISSKLSLELLKSILKFQFIFALVYLIITLPFFSFFTLSLSNNAESVGTLLVGGIAILFMTLPYHSKNKQVAIFISVFLVLIINMINARRNQVVFFSSVVFFGFLISLFSNSSLIRQSRFKIILYYFAIVLMLCIMIFSFSNSFILFWERIGTGMESRTFIIDKFYSDFNYTPVDWITGRGIFGEYDGGLQFTNENTGKRDVIENGYLFIILKGGWIYLGLLIIISLNAVYKGFFKSKNILIKGMAAIILINFIYMVGFGLPSLTLKYFMFFISIAGCNTIWLRECSDEFLSKKIGLK